MATPEAGEPHARFDEGARLGADPALDRSSRVRRGVRSPGLSHQCSTLPPKELFVVAAGFRLCYEKFLVAPVSVSYTHLTLPTIYSV